MSTDSMSTANYAAVIADLRAKRDELERTISMLEAMAQLAPSGTAAVSQPVRPVFVMDATADAPLGHFVSPPATGNTGIGDAVARILKDNQGRALSTREVTDLLLRSGFPQTTENPVNNVWSALSHRMKTKGDVAREGKNWRFARLEKAPQANSLQNMNGH
ncbi:hypothetical protein HYPDE_28113 [Hyphomicrobium denitrificans 1NES1]|uniref:HTH HARE-type domain-containing protein n=1 Tax=Hyphomicrobium denitrificans 1NES1 TaxID=670307 RepID=N0B503_9HYPH|nr:hypothetical protein [Hyphomicrobium denitrificans]AGK57302.1 hypothetical protein HYPDE_28113 [Hyphomicrobium denitrificans 1NES1]